MLWRIYAWSHDDVLRRKHFRITCLLCGEFTYHRWIPRTKASDVELWCFLWFAPEKTDEQTMETPVIWRHRTHCDVIVMFFLFNQCLIAAILCWVSASWYRHQMMLIDSYNIFPSYTIDFNGTVWGHYICLINIYSLKCLIRSLNNSECKTSLTKLQMLLFWALQANPQENRTKVSAFIIKNMVTISQMTLSNVFSLIMFCILFW